MHLFVNTYLSNRNQTFLYFAKLIVIRIRRVLRFDNQTLSKAEADSLLPARARVTKKEKLEPEIVVWNEVCCDCEVKTCYCLGGGGGAE